MKKVISLILSLTMLLTITAALDLTAFADTYSGTCGDNVTWLLDTETGELIISGSGDMSDYDSSGYIGPTCSSNAPWYNYRTYIKAVTILDGVTSIGEEVFYNLTSLASVTIPDGVTSTENFSFYYCESLTNIIIPDSVTRF
ncbi:MAG: leucine-rich repeat domain-containing protein [Clostridiales bacterium]|nr:leucine-rich repeat domain-containing protein [Clostridiales bacterium]